MEQSSSNLNFRELYKEEKGNWDELVSNSPQGSVFQTTSWLENLNTRSYKIFVCSYKNNIVAGIPITYIKKNGLKFATNPPFTPYLGVVFKTNENKTKYVNQLSFETKISITFANQLKTFPYFSFSFNYHFNDPLPFIWENYSVSPRFTYLLKLDNLDELLSNMERDTRNRVVTAQKYNLSIEKGKINDLTTLIELTYKRKGLKIPYTKNFYEESFKDFLKNMVLLIMKDNDEVIAGSLMAFDNKRSYYLIGGFKEDERYKGLGQLLIWNMITYSKNTLNLSEFDFVGTPNPNIERFFRGFGGELTPYYFINKKNNFYRLSKMLFNMYLKNKIWIL